jgi:hypothetical protein
MHPEIGQAVDDVLGEVVPTERTDDADARRAQRHAWGCIFAGRPW